MKVGRKHGIPWNLFWSHVRFGESYLDCWQWTGGTNGTGYGVTKCTGKQEYAHRVSYSWFFGTPLNEIDHVCRNRSCVNPIHLDDVTTTENSHRKPSCHKDKCTRGHAMTGYNLVQKNGAWMCRTCRVENTRRWRAKNADARKTTTTSSGI